MYGSSVDFTMQNNNGSYMQMPNNGNIHPQQMEWLMQQQRMQGSPMPAAASRAYHLEPMSAQQQQSFQGNGMMMMNGMGGMTPQQYGQMTMQPQQSQMGMGGGFGGPGGMSSVNTNNAGNMNGGPGAAYSNFAGMSSPHHGGPAGAGPNGDSGMGGMGGMGGGAGDWNQINFQGVFHTAADPQMQQNIFTQDDGKPLPFPPGHLLAQYPPDYQQQMVFYYRLLRLQYPELYQQYIDYYETFYEPLYFPRPPTPEVKERRQPPPKKKAAPPPQPQPRPAPPPQPVAPPPPVMQPLPPPVQEAPVEPPPKKPELQRSSSNLSGGLNRQSSMRRQNSMRRAEVNQLKNEGGLKRLPSMRKS